MPLRTAPLPRMAGDLTFMRARRATIDDLNANSLAVLGAPTELATAARTGCRYSPRAIRETSVYFGWHANPQFTQPVEIDRRGAAIDSQSLHDRLVDLGDIALGGRTSEEAAQRIAAVVEKARARGASLMVLGGDRSIVAPVLAGASAAAGSGSCRSALIQIGGEITTSPDRVFAPVVAVACRPITTIESLAVVQSAGTRVVSRDMVGSLTEHDWAELARDTAARSSLLHVGLDLSAVASQWHGMTVTPAFSGLGLPELRRVLSGIGQARVATLVVTGLEPTANGVTTVKTGQRLLVSSLLGYLYARLSFNKETDR